MVLRFPDSGARPIGILWVRFTSLLSANGMLATPARKIGCHMPRTLPQLLPTEKPRCDKCDTRMSLQRIDPGRKGFEHRVFECGRCYTLKTVPVSIDPMKSEKARWTASELNPPS
jgi:hypothetical protein